MMKAQIEAKSAREYFDAKRQVTLTSQTGWAPIIANTQLFTGYDTKALSDIYSKSDLVFACIREKATSFSEAPIEVGRYTDDGFEPVEGHEALRLFYDNPYYSYVQLMELIIARLDLTGAAFVMLDKFKNRLGVGGIVPVPTHIVRMVTEGPEIKKYVIRTGDREVEAEPDEICPICYLDPSTYRGYTSPLAAAIREYQIDCERQNITQETLKNKDIPGLILSSAERLNSDQREMLKASLAASVGRASGDRARSIVLPNGISVEDTAANHDINFEHINGLSESRIAMVFGVPLILVGAKTGIDAATYSNYGTARKSFYRETMQPLWAFVADTLTRYLLPDVDLDFRFRTEDIGEMKEEANDIADRAALLFEKGVATLNESRQMVGLPPVEGGDETKQPAPVVAPIAPSNSSEEEGEMEGKAARLDPDGWPMPVPVGGEGPNGKLPQEDELAKVIAEEFASQKRAYIDNIKTGATVDGEALVNSMGARMGAIMLSAAEKRAYDRLVEIAKKAGLGEQENFVQSRFDLVRPGLERQIRNQSIKISSEAWGTTKKQTDKRIAAMRQALVDAGVSGPNTVKALSEAVARSFGIAEGSRSQTIAATEMSRAVHAAQVYSDAASGIIAGYIPEVSDDACELCQQYDEEGNPTGSALFGFTSMEDALSQVNSGAYAKTDGTNTTISLPPYHPNCRCAVTEIFTDETIPDSGKLRSLSHKEGEYNTKPTGYTPAGPLSEFSRDVAEELAND
jgi:HK97 family phage portal protein